MPEIYSKSSLKLLTKEAGDRIHISSGWIYLCPVKVVAFCIATHNKYHWIKSGVNHH